MATQDLIPLITSHTGRLLDTARSLTDQGAPTLCEGWTAGHVLSHVARNADGLAALVRSAVDGTGETMYVSPQDRDADIAAGADRTIDVLVEDVSDSADRANPLLARLGPAHEATMVERTPGVPFAPAGRLPFIRLREVVYHHVDLDSGFGFEDVEPELALTFLHEEVTRLGRVDSPPDLTLASTEGEEWTVGLGTARVSGSRAALLAWLARGARTGLIATSLPELPDGR
ncbi:MAG: maleylpyruvate isomerase family mycothiol-dependent enzyme [Ornithinibacter sp.]